jgi:hypothetical protein
VIEQGYRLDLLVMRKVVLEIKTVDKLVDVHRAQLPETRRLPTGISPEFQRIDDARRHRAYGKRTLGADLLRPPRLLRDLRG